MHVHPRAPGVLSSIAEEPEPDLDAYFGGAVAMPIPVAGEGIAQSDLQLQFHGSSLKMDVREVLKAPCNMPHRTCPYFKKWVRALLSGVV